MVKKYSGLRCKFCDKEITDRYFTYANAFCDNSCQANHQNNLKVQAWLRGDYSGMRGETSLSAPIRNYLLKQADYKCSLCGWNEINPTTGKCPLEIDHIDGSHTNNSPTNLRVLCPNCHSLTPTYKSLNKGKGRGLKLVNGSLSRVRTSGSNLEN